MTRLLSGGRLALLVTLLAASVLGLAPFSSQPAAASTLTTSTAAPSSDVAMVPRPDPVVSSWRVTYSFGWRLAITVKNQGEYEATGFYTDYNGSVRWLPGGLAAGTSTVVSFPLTHCETRGTITVDVFRQVTETLETNNTQAVHQIC